jgi:glycosyltransferase involved in cell wall biosynthesis
VSRLLVVSYYAPYRDGIAAYALQEVRWLRAQGHEVEVLSPVPSAAHHHLPLGGPRSAVALARFARGYDRVVVQYHPELFLGRCRSPRARVATWLALVAFTRAARVELRLHEVDFSAFAGNPVERALAARMLRKAAELSVHTPAERDRLADELGVPASRITVIEHGRAFRRHTAADRDAARRELGLADDTHVFLSIGFIQAHKGFDRAVAAFGRAGLGRAEYHVVGSTRVEHPEYVAYARELQRLVEATPGAHLHHRYVSDEEFDRWILAADTVVLPYREIWSSGVIERCRLYDTPAIVSRVGGLEDQVPEGTRLVGDDDEELVAALQEAAPEAVGARSDAPETPPASDAWAVDAAAPDRLALQEQVRRRAAAQGGPAGSEVLGDATAALRAVGPVVLPPPVSARPGAARAKRLVSRLIGWQTGSLAAQVAAHQQATADAVTSLEARVARLEDGQDAIADLPSSQP